MSSTVNQNNINTTNDHEATLRNGKIGDAADGRRLNSTGTKGSSVTSGMNVGAQVTPISVKTGEGVKTLEGSFPGDHRASANKTDITAAFKNQAGPRGETDDTELEGA
jgi:hypothetical protein